MGNYTRLSILNTLLTSQFRWPKDKPLLMHSRHWWFGQFLSINCLHVKNSKYASFTIYIINKHKKIFTKCLARNLELVNYSPWFHFKKSTFLYLSCPTLRFLKSGILNLIMKIVFRCKSYECLLNLLYCLLVYF